MANETKQAMLERAANLVGEQQLAVALDVPHSVLLAWMHGQNTMPIRNALALADILALARR